MKATPVTSNYLILITLLAKIFGKSGLSAHPIEDKSRVTALINACLLGDPPNKSNPNFLPDFLQSYIEFNKVELNEEQCKKRDEIHFIHKDGINIAKKYLTTNLIN